MTRAERFEELSGTHGVRRDLKRRSIRGAVFMASGGGLDLVVRLVGTFIMARLLAPEHFGLLAMATAFTTLVDAVKDLGLPMATMQRAEITEAETTNLFWINTAAGVGFALIFGGLSPFIASFYGDPRLIYATIAVSTSFVWVGLSVQHRALLSRQLRQGELAFIQVAANILSLICAIYLAVSGWGYWALIWREVITNALFAVGTWLWCPWIPGLPQRNVPVGSLLRFGRNLSATNFVTGLIANIDRLLIGKFFGAAAVGMYRQAQQLMMVPIDQMNIPIAAVSQPGLSALQGEPERYRRYYRKIVFLVSLVTIPLGLFVAVYAREVTLIVLGPAWVDSAVFLRLFAIASMVRPAIATTATVLVTCGQSMRYMVVALAHSALLAVLMVVGLPWGAAGVALAHVSTSILLAVPKLYYSFSESPVRVSDFMGAIKIPAMASAVMMLMLLWSHSVLATTSVLQTAIYGFALGGASYLVAWLLIPGGKAQLLDLLQDVLSALKRRRSTHATAEIGAV